MVERDDARQVHKLSALQVRPLRLADAAKPTWRRDPVDLPTLTGSLSPQRAHLHASVADARRGNAATTRRISSRVTQASRAGARVFASSRSCSTRHSTLPAPDFGSASTNSTSRGYL